jgi:hypothetical protein
MNEIQERQAQLKAEVETLERLVPKASIFISDAGSNWTLRLAMLQ